MHVANFCSDKLYNDSRLLFNGILPTTINATAHNY